MIPPRRTTVWSQVHLVAVSKGDTDEMKMVNGGVLSLCVD